MRKYLNKQFLTRTFYSSGGFAFELERCGLSWFYRVSKRSFFRISRNGKKVELWFCTVPARGSYMSGEKAIKSELVGIGHSMKDTCNALVTYELNGAWWK